MNRVWAARIVAPAAFLAGVTLAIVLVRAGLGDEPPATTVVATRTLPTATTGTTSTAPQRRFARVREGDTLEALAARHDTTVERLLELNPGLDATNLQIGQRVRVR